MVSTLLYSNIVKNRVLFTYSIFLNSMVLLFYAYICCLRTLACGANQIGLGGSKNMRARENNFYYIFE